MTWRHWLNDMVSWRRRFATGSIGSLKNRSSKHPTTIPDQVAPRSSTNMSGHSSSNNSSNRRQNSATNNKRGHRNYCSTTSKKSTESNTVKATLGNSWERPGCPAGQHGRAITRLTRNEKPSFNRRSKKTAETDRENCRCRRSVHQARRHSTTTWLVPNRIKSNDRDIELVG